MKKKKILALICVLTVCFVAICVAGTLTVKQQSLEGIDTLCASVIVSKETPNSDLLSSQLRTDIELKLRRNGIKVISAKDLKNSPLTPVLNVAITSLSVSNSIGTMGSTSVILVYLTEYATLARNNKFILAATWTDNNIIISNSQEYSKYAREVVSDSVDKFLNNFWAANPKEQPKKGNIFKQDTPFQKGSEIKPKTK